MNQTTNQVVNTAETQPIPTIAPQPPSLPSPQFQLDPTNPLIWILTITWLLGNTDEVIKAIADLLKAIASLKSVRNKERDKNDRGSKTDQ